MEAVKNTVSHLLGGNTDTTTDSTTEGSTTQEHSHQHTEDHHHTKGHDDQVTSTTTGAHDQKTSPATETASKPTSAGNSGSNDQHSHGDSGDSGDMKRVQSPDQGPDPALVGDPVPTDKLTGTGAPGSHSALFGLTPDGKKNTEASKGSGVPQAAHSKEPSVGSGKSTGDDNVTS